SADPPPPPIYPLSLHDALPISRTTIAKTGRERVRERDHKLAFADAATIAAVQLVDRPDTIVQETEHGEIAARVGGVDVGIAPLLDRKSTRLNSSHVAISYAVFC